MSANDTGRPTAEQERALIERSEKVQRVPTGFGVRLSGFDEAWRMATAISRSDLAPKDFKGKPENCFIAMQMGAELGLSPMAALRSIAVINGRPSVWGDGALAIVQARPEYESHEEIFEGDGESRTAIFKIKRRGQPLHVVRFGVLDAKKANLWTKDGPWKTYPDRMLQMRARGWGLRDKFADALCGLSIAEEAMDMPGPVIDAEPDAITTLAAQLPVNLQRASEMKLPTTIEAEVAEAQAKLEEQRQQEPVDPPTHAEIFGSIV